jgi:phosphoesterase RecJ-like protein
LKIKKEFKKALELINNAHYILIVTHINPDADTLTSALALSNFMFEKKIKHKVFNKTDQLPRSLDFIDRFDKITNTLPKFYDLVIFVDCANIQRVGVELNNKIPIVNIDHHKSNTNFGIINIVEPDFASSAEVVYDFFKYNNLTISKQVAKALYVGIYDDSLKFTAPRTNLSTFDKIHHLVSLGIDPSQIANDLLKRDSLAKYRLLPKVLNSLELHFEGKVATIYLKDKWLKQTGATYKECDDVANMVLNISIVDIVVYLRVSNSKTRVSLRSKNNCDVLTIAKYFNGGGHLLKAGCDCDTTKIKKAKKMILKYIKDNKGYNE